MRLFLILGILLNSWLTFDSHPGKETFQQFLKKFNQGLNYQKKHIRFPLSVVHSEETSRSGKEERFFIAAKDWKYITLGKRNDPKNTFSIRRKGQDLYSIILQREDTGIYIVYQFRCTSKGWYLELMRDEST